MTARSVVAWRGGPPRRRSRSRELDATAQLHAEQRERRGQVLEQYRSKLSLAAPARDNSSKRKATR